MKGDSIFLRALEPTDVDLLYLWENDVSLWKVSNTFAPFSRFSLEQYVINSGSDIFASRQLRLMICNVQNPGIVVGAIDLFDFDPYHLRAGVGIVITAGERQKGYAAEALKILEEYCFKTLCLHQLYCNISEDNLNSRALFEKSGYVFAGEKREWLKDSAGWKSELIFQKINKLP